MKKGPYMEIFNSGVACRKLASASILTVWVLFTLAGHAVEAQEKATKCEIRITAPSPGDKVGKQGKVEGKGKIPTGSYLWVLAHVKYLTEDWWPQGRRAAAINEDSSWMVLTGYGEPPDIGADFEIALAVVNEQVNTQLRQWVQKGDQTGKYPPIEFPNVIGGCPPVKITVNKSSHE
jgi:hypothetical protein